MTIYAGFDIGGTHARLGLFDEHMQPLNMRRERIRGLYAPGDVARVMVAMLGEGLGELGLVTIDRGAVGVGLAGQMSRDGQMVFNGPNLGWRDVPFASILAEILRQEGRSGAETPVRLCNDLSALVWGERARGAVQQVEEALAVYVGTGIGGAILMHGRLQVGSGGKAGELGHVKALPGGRLCGCGERGCVEAYAGGVHLEAQVAALVEPHGLHEVLVEGDPARVDLAVADRLSNTHPELAIVWEQATDYLAIALANACTLLNPEVLLLGGGVLAHCPHFKASLLTKTVPLVLEAARRDLDIREPSLGEEAGILGAALLARDT